MLGLLIDALLVWKRARWATIPVFLSVFLFSVLMVGETGAMWDTFCFSAAKFV
jgi:hypothetical protein